MVGRLELIEQKCRFAAKSAARLRRYETMTNVPTAIVEHERRLLETRLAELDVARQLGDDVRLFLPDGIWET